MTSNKRNRPTAAELKKNRPPLRVAGVITQQQRAFLGEYATTLEPEKSAIAAGYSSTAAKKVARELLVKPHIVRELQKLISERADYLDVCRGFMVGKYLELIDHAFKDGLNDPPLGLRALDGLAKQLPKEGFEGAGGLQPLKIEGLDTSTI